MGFAFGFQMSFVSIPQADRVGFTQVLVTKQVLENRNLDFGLQPKVSGDVPLGTWGKIEDRSSGVFDPGSCILVPLGIAAFDTKRNAGGIGGPELSDDAACPGIAEGIALIIGGPQ